MILPVQLVSIIRHHIKCISVAVQGLLVDVVNKGLGLRQEVAKKTVRLLEWPVAGSHARRQCEILGGKDGDKSAIAPLNTCFHQWKAALEDAHTVSHEREVEIPPHSKATSLKYTRRRIRSSKLRTGH